MERDRRKLEDDKHSIEDRSAKFEAELRLVTRERDRYTPHKTKKGSHAFRFHYSYHNYIEKLYKNMK